MERRRPEPDEPTLTPAETRRAEFFSVVGPRILLRYSDGGPDESRRGERRRRNRAARRSRRANRR